MRERFISTLLDLLTAIGLYIYVNLRKNNTYKISRMYRTECQNSFRSYVHQHACAEKTHVLLDLSAKDTALELMYINMHVRGNFWN